MNLGDEGGSPWDDVPSRSHSNQNLKAAGDEAQNAAPPDQQDTPAPSASTTSRSGTTRGKRTIRRYEAQPTSFQPVDDSLGPLGPLGDSYKPPAQDEPPAPPQKEQASTRSSRPTTATSQSSIRSMMDSVNLDDEEDATPSRPRIPPPVQPPSNDAPRRQTQPSMSVEQAAKPTFQITVGDPHKVGDLTSSHTEYQVRTKQPSRHPQTTSKAYRTEEFAVSRRYRDFLWLYSQLHTNNPGVVVPAPPEKQAVGRFDADFVESRRAALERMLNKICAHPILQHDGDLKLFLESEAFNVDIKHKERKEPMLGSESKGMFGGLGLGGGGGKFVEHDDWFHDRRVYLDALETQLKALLKATDAVVIQRKGLAEAAGDFSASLHSLAAVELSPSLSDPLDALSVLQTRIRELYERQAQQDVLTLGIVIDEYIRLIGSVKKAFEQRQKAYHAWHAAESELSKRKGMQDKLLRQGRSQQDRLNQMNADVSDAERKVHAARLLFEDMGRLMRGELERFEREKVEDFKSGVETFLESAVEAQKELIELWETYLFQLDDEEEGKPFGHSIPPAGIRAAGADIATKDAAATPVDSTRPSTGDDSRPESQGTEGESSIEEARAAAGVTREVEE
ncbi:Vacuolar protein sorting-associated protein vps5 [Coniosporium apollinis]|uniref:Vacuolar protein sorting-associated protein vps5 n=1 Tax=Coniosporium apollinis TaxID=61459 RepID=A0ABQ9NUZ5_9PEZI|nr:Vacuolar protein sorting-associated protein vps5 [Coniosporium apollinis]